MTRAQIIDIVHSALDAFLAADSALLIIDASERSMTHKLAEHINTQLILRKIEGLQVDCEYNRNQGKPKYINLEAKRKELLECRMFDEEDELTVTTFPDILIHQRGNNDHNELIIEAKKWNSKVDPVFDCLKLTAFTERSTNENFYRYKVGLFLTLLGKEAAEAFLNKTTEDKPFSVEWFDDGRNATEEALKRLDKP